MKEVLIINDVYDFSQYVEHKGVGWSRNDIDGEGTIRTKAGTMRRDKLTTKRKVSYKLVNMPQSELALLDDLLSKPTFRAKYIDLHGVETREFYTSSFSATLADCSGDTPVWDGATFNMTEV